MNRQLFLRAAAFGLLMLVLVGLGGTGQAALPTTAKLTSNQSNTNTSLALPAHAISLQQDSYNIANTAAHANRTGIWKPLSPVSFILDDGSQETVFGLNIYYHGIPLIAINRFTPNPADFPFTITQISIQFPDPTAAFHDLTGRNIDLLVYEDPTGSGDPANASKIYQQPFTIQVADGVSFSNYPVNIHVQGPGDVYIGFSNTYDHGNQQPYSYPVPIDRSQSQLRSWIATNVSGADPDYNDLANNLMLTLIDNIGQFLGGNFVVRASGQTGTVATSTPAPPTVTPTSTPTNTPPSGPTFTPTSTPTIGPPCGAILPTASASCSSPSTYDYTFSFYIESGCISSANGPAILTFDVAPTAGGPFTQFDQEIRQVTFPPGPTIATFTGTLTETNIPPQYTVYRIGFNGASIVANAYAQTQAGNLCSNVTPTTTIIPSLTVTPTTCALTFSDVPQDSTFYPYIRCLACRGILGGYPDGTFKPNNDVTRGQLSKIVSNAAGFNDPQATQMFEDVPVDATFFQYVGRLASRGYIGGYACGSPGELCGPVNLPYFRPGNRATRGQISKIVSNAASFNDTPTGQQFEDVAPGSTYYTYTYRLVSRSIMSGYQCGGTGEPCQPGNLPYFRPNNNATRGQTSKIVSNTFFPNCQTPSLINSKSMLQALTSSTAPIPAAPPPPQWPNVVLYDQYDHISINTTNSQNFEPSLATYSDFLADDIVVPSGQTWTIDEVDVAGAMTGNGQADSFNVALYTDAGLPGTIIYTATNLAYTMPVQGEHAITLTPPAVVGPGTYYLMVQANHPSIYAGGGQWGWYNRGLLFNHPAAWINPGNGWGTSCNEDTGWGVRWTCQGDLPNPDQVWRVLGTLGGSATNTPAPPTNTSTNTPTRTTTPVSTIPAHTNTPTATHTQSAVASGTVPPTSTFTQTPLGTIPPTRTVSVPTIPPTPTTCALTFSDVPQDSTFYPFIRCLACRGILGGYPDGTFKPNNDVTRGQLSKIVSNAAGFNDTQATQMFEDVPVDATFFQYVGRLASRGYIGGYACGSPGELCGPVNLPYFRPGNRATRGQISKIVSNAASFSDTPSGEQFEDVAPGSTYYTYTYRLVSRSIMSGYQCGGTGEPCQPGNLPYFRPNNNATRGQTSKIVGNTFFPNCQTPAGTLR